MRILSNKIAARIAAFGLLAAAVLGTTVTAYADVPKDYTIYGTYWEESNGSLFATWEKAEDSTSYRVQLYKGSVSANKKVGNPYTTSSAKKDYTSVIADKGSGTYYFTVYPVKGGTDMTVTSEALEVDSTMIRNAKKAKQDAANAPVKGTAYDGQPIGAGTPVWDRNPDSSWTYYNGDGTKVKSAFAEINGQKYYFNSNGCTLYGWQFISSRWYYFEPKGNATWPQGAMYRNTTTPDGYTVNEKGEWTVGGVVQTSKNATADTSRGNNGTLLIKNCSITVKTDTSAGAIPKLVPSAASNCRIADYSYSAPYEYWTVGDSIDINVVLEPNAGYEFYSGVKFTCSGATPITNSGAAGRRTVVLRYTPSAQLPAPSGLYVYQDDYTVHWDKVPGATRYRVKVTGGSQSKTEIITETEYDVSGFINDDDFMESVGIKITALGPESNKSIKESPAAEIKDVEMFAMQNGISTDFSRDGKTVTYTQTGWQQIGGSWYYFNDNYEAIGGWYQDKPSNYWYYMDPSSKRMLTGYITESGTRYFLNDGSVAGVPEGAWIEGR